MLIDDHPLVRQGLKKVFDKESDFYVCAEASNAESAIKSLSEVLPDIVIIDVSLKEDIDGIDLIGVIKKRFGNIKILVLSMHDEVIYVERAIRAGAKGYVTKNDPLDIVSDAIKAVISGDIYISASITGKFIKKLISTPENHVNNNIHDSSEPLTNRELEVFNLIGRGYATGEIARELNISVNTVESHRRHIKEKLGIQKGTDILKFAIQWIIDKELNRSN